VGVPGVRSSIVGVISPCAASGASRPDSGSGRLGFLRLQLLVCAGAFLDLAEPAGSRQSHPFGPPVAGDSSSESEHPHDPGVVPMVRPGQRTGRESSVSVKLRVAGRAGQARAGSRIRPRSRWGGGRSLRSARTRSPGGRSGRSGRSGPCVADLVIGPVRRVFCALPGDVDSGLHRRPARGSVEPPAARHRRYRFGDRDRLPHGPITSPGAMPMQVERPHRQAKPRWTPAPWSTRLW